MTKRIIAPRSRLWQLLQDLGTLFAFGAVVAAAGMILPYHDAHTPRTGSQRRGDDRPDGDIAVMSQVLDIWLPEPLVDLAKREFQPCGLNRDEGLEKVLDRKEYQDLFHAFTVRGFQSNSDAVIVTYVRYPYHVSEHYQELVDLLATAAGSPPRYAGMDYSGTTIHIVPAGTSRQDLLAAIQETQASSVLSEPAGL
jgi:hypothetical protein